MEALLQLFWIILLNQDPALTFLGKSCHQIPWVFMLPSQKMKFAVVMMTRTPAGYCTIMNFEWWQPNLPGVQGANTLCVPMLLHEFRAAEIAAALQYKQLCICKCIETKV